MELDSAIFHEVSDKIRAYLEDKITVEDINFWVLEKMNATEQDIKAGPHTDLLNHIFWAIRLLQEPEEFATSKEELEYLLKCLEGKAQFSKSDIDKLYRKDKKN